MGRYIFFADNFYITIVKDVGLLNFVFVVAQSVIKCVVSYVIFSGLNLYWNDFAIINYNEIDCATCLCVEICVQLQLT